MHIFPSSLFLSLSPVVSFFHSHTNSVPVFFTSSVSHFRMFLLFFEVRSKCALLCVYMNVVCGFESLLLLFSSFGFIGPNKSLYIIFDFLLVNRLTAYKRAYKLMLRKYFDDFFSLCPTRRADVSNNMPRTLQKKKKNRRKMKKKKRKKIKRTDGRENAHAELVKCSAKLFIWFIAYHVSWNNN